MPVVTPMPGSPVTAYYSPQMRPAMLSTLDAGLNATPTLQSPSSGWKRRRAAAVLDECRLGTPSSLRREVASTGYRPQARAVSSLPRELAVLEEIRARTLGKRLVIFLDYDGTLTPIVSNPEDAVLSDGMRAAVGRLAASKEVAIVSGRSREKVEAFVQLQSLIYAGSHGFDIAGPDGLRHRIAEEALPMLAAARDALAARLANIPGATVEDNEFSVSVHWRNVAQEHRAAVEAATRAEVEARPGLKVTTGKCVFEVRPELPDAPVWHKGAAVRFLLDHLLRRGEGDESMDALEEVVPIYIGDDLTDEDAFEVLHDLGGLSFLVAGAGEAERPRETYGSHVLANCDEVQALLTALASL